MAIENKASPGVKIIIDSKAGACGQCGVTICGSDNPGCEKLVIDMQYFENLKDHCKNLNDGKGGCCLCTADPKYPDSVSKFCPFAEY